MIFCNLSSTSSLLRDRRKLFCDISNPEVATHPALDAFPGEKSIFASWNAAMASGVEGIFAHSPTTMTPFLTKVSASLLSNSFCVAHGKAISHFTSRGFLFSMNFAPNLSAYSLILHLLLFFKSFKNSNFS
jgi:hypothetical protein